MIDYTDIFIIGGGINGVAIAADAAGRGLSVRLCEKNDLSAGTSWASSKLIHGGLRYLEFYEFGLVKKALHEREILLFRAPFLVKPLEFILPHEKHLRPAWMIRIGLFLYDHLSMRKTLPGSTSISFKNDERGLELQPHLTRGFSYYDCFTDDARLVILNAISAKEKGAIISTRTEFISAVREKDYWKITLKNVLNNHIFFHYAKILCNVTGPWVKETQNKIRTDLTFDIHLDKGSHIVVPKLYDGDFAYILQHSDKRIVFAIPYLEKYTLIGTTDVPYMNNPDHITISHEEIDYLCSIINRYFKKVIHKNDLIWSYSGVRCLQAKTGHSAATTTRDFQCLTENINNLPLVSIIGGKLTTHRVLAESIVNQLTTKPAWTSTASLPGGDIPDQDFHKFCDALQKNYPWLPKNMILRYAKNYGTRVHILLENAHSLHDLGEDFSHGLYQKEVEYLVKYEWAMTADDILWRRTKLGLEFSEVEKNKLESWLQNIFEFM